MHKPGLAFRASLGLSCCIAPVAPMVLRRRVKAGKESDTRWREKLGITDAARPAGPLIWLHGVGLGEMLALRGLVQEIMRTRPEVNILVTSSTLISANVFPDHFPKSVIHQFLPLDTPSAVERFVAHWRPDLVIWSDQDLWPRLMSNLWAAKIPQALVNGRLPAGRLRAQATRRFYRSLLGMLDHTFVQSNEMADAIKDLGLNAQTHMSLKASAPRLAPTTTRAPKLDGRKLWVAAPTHPSDEDHVISAHQAVIERDPNHLLAIAPRDIRRAPEIIRRLNELGLSAKLSSDTKRLSKDLSVIVIDTYGELGTWYERAHCAFIGGSFGDTQGHNPWEAIAFDLPIMHGPQTENFAEDYRLLSHHNAAIEVVSASALAQQIEAPDLTGAAQNAKELRSLAQSALEELTAQLIETAGL